MRMKLNKRLKKYCTGMLAVTLLLSNCKITIASSSQELSKDGWRLSWSDEFDGTELNLENWSYEKGNWIVDGNGNKVDSGWGNNELEYYTEGDNLELKDGKLVITAKKETVNDPIQGEFDYTSSRIVTKDKVTTKYGRIEASIKLPEGNGLWPAFWMMPNDDKYGAWASSGEIDIMESRGDQVNSVAGTIHYGGKWPNNRHTGKTYDIPNKGKISDFHEYAVEWEPGEIRWYVDGVLCNTQNNWYSVDGNGEKYSFPAPFDQDFYIILNLALGGWFAGMDPDEDFSQAEMLVDYVRVYDKVGGYQSVTEEPTVDKEELPQGAKPAIEGNYVYDVDFKSGFNDITTGNQEFTDKWNFLRLSDFGGRATISTEDIGDNTFAKIDISNGGSQPYSVQLIQHVTMTKGHTYKVSYDAKSNSNRDINIKVSGGADRGYATYSDNYVDELTTDIQHFEHIFTMSEQSDAKARLEFNVGLNTNTVWVGNIKVEEVESKIDNDIEKKPLVDGNYIYNGTFDKGTIDRKAYWNLDVKNNAKAKYLVHEDARELFVDITNGGIEASDIILNQKGIKLEKDGKYILVFNAKINKSDDTSKDIKILMKDSKGNIIDSEDVTVKDIDKMGKYTVSFDIGNVIDKNGVIEFQVGGSNTSLYLDNIVLENNFTEGSLDIEKFPLKNGDFTQGLTGWDSWSAIEANIEGQDGKAVVNIPNKFSESGDGAETWAVQLKQSELKLYEGIEYLVSFEASSTIDRKVELVAQNKAYNRVFEDKVSLGIKPKKYTYSFIAPATEVIELNFLLGKYEDYAAHSITIDNVILEVKSKSDSILKNNSFKEEKEPWYMWSETDCTDSIIDESWSITIPSVGQQFWSVQAIQEGISVEAGKNYRLVFDMSSSIPRDIQVILDPAKELLETVSIDTEMKTYVINYNNKTKESNGKFLFALGNLDGNTQLDNHTIKIDNVYLYEIPELLSDVKPETDKTISEMEVTQGPEIIVGADGGCGFTFPIFNNGKSSFNDIKEDLNIFIKENGKYILIEESDLWKYDENWGHFWDGTGGYWFNPVNETISVKLASKVNPEVFIEYTLKVDKVENNEEEDSNDDIVDVIPDEDIDEDIEIDEDDNSSKEDSDLPQTGSEQSVILIVISTILLGLGAFLVRNKKGKK